MSTHIIHKQKVHLQTTISTDAFALQNRISSMLRNDVPGKLESLFNKISPNGEILRIDKLELNLGTVNAQNLEAEFSHKLIEQLSIALSELKNNNDETKYTEIEHKQSMIDTLIYFLHYGYMPWYQAAKNFSVWESEMLHSFSEKEWALLVEELKSNLSGNNYVVKRLAMQFTEAFLEKILFQLHNTLDKNRIQSFTERFFNDADPLKKAARKLFWQLAITVALGTRNENDFTIEFLKRMDGDTKESREMNSGEIKTVENKNKRKDGPGEEEFFAENCGIVILHPFLLMYFLELGLLEDNDFKNDEMRQRAVLLLHYLATGETQVAEFNLIVAKLLCAVDFDEPVPNYIELTEKEKEESASLLKSVTHHWEPLQRTSPDGLRASFLQREGKLKQRETGWLLQVEQKTIDMLLDRLPWGIGTIKLPWMKDTLNVEWC
jgi:hypothetical protein